MGLFDKKPVSSPRQGRPAHGLASEEFARRGMAFDPPPDYEQPRMPYDLGDHSDSSLMMLFNQFTEWTNYIATELTRAVVEEDDAEADLEIEEAKFIVLNTEAGKPGVQRATKERRVDQQVNVLRARVLEKKALRKMIETLFNNMERSTFALSRELSRRIGLAPAQGRMNRTTS